jgi:O-antigen/teichoic acid export membrane protein
LRNIVSNWLGYIVASVVAIFLAPFLVHHLGNTGYGIWTLVLSITGYFGLLDFGIRSSVGRFVARYVALGQPENVNRTISNAMALLGCGSLLTLAATGAMSFAIRWFHVSAGMQPAARAALLLAGLNIAFALPMGVFSGVLIALERYDVLSKASIAATLCQAVLVVLFLKAGYDIVAVAAIAFVVSTTQYLFLAVYAKSSCPTLRIGWGLVNVAGWRELFGFSAYRFLYIVANQLIFYSDSLVIAAFLGAAAITPYAIAGSLIWRGRDLVGLATDTLYPAASRMDGLKNHAAIRNVHMVGTTMALLLGLPICLGFIFFGRQFITLWMGPQYAVSATILTILTIPQFTSLPQYSAALVLASMARHKPLAYMMLAEGVANLVLSLFLVRRMGIVGVAWGTVIPHIVNTTILIPAYTLRVLDIPLAEFLRKAVLRPVLGAVPAAALCYLFSVSVTRPTWGVFAMEVAAVCAISGAIAYFSLLSPEQKLALRGKTAEAFSK